MKGQVLYDSNPAVGVKVRLCEEIEFFGGCKGATYQAVTDATGSYSIDKVKSVTTPGMVLVQTRETFPSFSESSKPRCFCMTLDAEEQVVSPELEIRRRKIRKSLFMAKRKILATK